MTEDEMLNALTKFFFCSAIVTGVLAGIFFVIKIILENM